ncbi:MAG: hypothetical protein HYZ42_09645 [Bacteroidetes bacterium]|nr:hypothetical protein [Bacteroidota bacterium]
MKYSIIIFLLLLSFLKGFSQNVIANADFEDWVQLDTFKTNRPNYWRVDSTIYFLTQGASSPVMQSEQSKNGLYSLGMKYIYMPNYLATDTIRNTFIFKGRPSSLTGCYKFTNQTNLINAYIDRVG